MLCALCKGSRNLCGKQRCPALLNYYIKISKKEILNRREIEGTSPPGVFVGSFGYPKVYAGPLVSPFHSDTSILDTPEMWLGKSIDEIVDYRASMVRGKQAVSVDMASPEFREYKKNVKWNSSEEKLLEKLTLLTLSKNYSYADAEFSKKPMDRLTLYGEFQPLSPSAPLKKFDTENIKTERKLEKAYYDKDLRAAEAILMLYNAGIEVSRITKALSIGAFGIAKQRKLVPTRWSITAVDYTVSKELIQEIKKFNPINEYRIYEFRNLDNVFVVLMLPVKWKYELIEAWYPNTIWNMRGKDIAIYSSHEFYNGRSEYAEIGGCYYAARLSVAEALRQEKKQAGIVIMREAYPGYIMPVGVWNVRESVRAALKTKPLKFRTLSEALNYACSRLKLAKGIWINKSEVLKSELYQRKITEFA